MLITSRTPLRVSFFGGGTDYPEYYTRYPGAVVGMAINRYIYISALKLAHFIQYKYRVSYRSLELVERCEDIKHPVVRATLEHLGVEDALDINIMADLPASSGLGSSSSFTVGLINLFSTVQGRPMTRLDLSRTATHIERELLAERVGVQDQLHAAFGGVNRFDFEGKRIRISPLQLHSDVAARVLGSLYLVYTGVQRYASDMLDEQILATSESKVDRQLGHLLKLTDQAVSVLESEEADRALLDFGAMMHEGWMTKRQLSSKVSNARIDALYDAALAAGALGGKLCGAGGGGFLLMVVPAERAAAFKECMRDTHVIKIDMDSAGSTILMS
jgi:D-glycero-alpha-D-manno-heptose-7-phosphate kinase